MTDQHATSMTRPQQPQRGNGSELSGLVSRKNPHYLARNLDLCTAYGLNAGLCKTLARMCARNDCPLWLVNALNDYIDRSNVLIGALRRYRDDIPKYIDG